MNKLLTKIVGVVLGTTMAVGVGVGVAVNSDRANVDSQVNAADTGVFSWSRSGNTDTKTSGYTFTATASAKSGYYQDGSGDTGIKMYSTSAAICSSTPASVTFTAKVGGGSGNKDLTNNVTVDFVNASGEIVSNSNTLVTSHITNAGGDTYNISMPVSLATSAYGIYVHHTKETGYNVRYFSFSLSYEAGSGHTHTWVKGETHAPTCTEEGYTEYTCSGCDETKHDDIVAALGHAWGDWSVTTPAICTEHGVETRVCSRDANHTETREIEPLGHNYVDGVCTRCGAEEPDEKTATFDFSKIDFTGWTNSYSGQEHTINYSEGDVYFAETAKPASDQTIHDIPVTKAGYATFVAGNDIEILEATFVFRQWGSKTKTVELWYSTDGGDNYTSTGVTSSSFTISKSNLPTGTNALKVTFSETSNQVGFESLSIVYTGGSVPTPTTYTVTYDANGGEGTMTDPDSPYAESATVTTLNNTFTRDGYTFASWNTETDGSGTDYDEGATFTIAENTTLYAIWEEASAHGTYVVMEPGTNGSNAVVNNKAAIKVGTSKVGGDMTITVPAHTTKIKLYAAAWNGVSGLSLNISGATVSPSSIALTADAGIASNSPFTLVGSESDYLFTLELSSITEETELTFASSAAKRFVVWGANLMAESFSSIFNANLNCNDAGTSEPTYADGFSWGEFKDIYLTLDSTEKGRLHDAKAITSGTVIEQAMARYDYIESKYNPNNSDQSAYINFIGRTVTPIGGANSNKLIVDMNASNVATIIVVTSVISLSTLCGYFLLRKRKEQ